MVFLQTIVIALGNNQDNMRKWLVIFVLQQSQARGNISAGWALSVSFLLLLFWIDVFMGLFKQEQCRRFLNRDILDILFLTRFMVSFTDVLKTQKKKLKKAEQGLPLVVQCLRLCLPMQGMLVQSLRSHMPQAQTPKHKTEEIL